MNQNPHIKLQDVVPQYEDLERQYQGDPDALCNDHEKLIGKNLNLKFQT